MLRRILVAVLYTALSAHANAGSLDGLLTGGMQKLVPVAEPVALPDVVLLDATEAPRALAKSLKAEGFKFCGPTITYAFMQAVGMVNDHAPDCAWANV